MCVCVNVIMVVVLRVQCKVKDWDWLGGGPEFESVGKIPRLSSVCNFSDLHLK